MTLYEYTRRCYHGRVAWNLLRTKASNEQRSFSLASQLNAPNAEDEPLERLDERRVYDHVRLAVQQVKRLNVANAEPPAGRYPLPDTVDLARRLKSVRSHDAKALRLDCRSSDNDFRHQPRRDARYVHETRHSRFRQSGVHAPDVTRTTAFQRRGREACDACIILATP